MTVTVTLASPAIRTPAALPCCHKSTAVTTVSTPSASELPSRAKDGSLRRLRSPKWRAPAGQFRPCVAGLRLDWAHARYPGILPVEVPHHAQVAGLARFRDPQRRGDALAWQLAAAPGR